MIRIHSSRVFVARPIAARRGRGVMRVLGAAAGLLLLAAASTVVLVVALGVGLVWGVRRLLSPSTTYDSSPSAQDDAQTLEGEYRVVRPASLPKDRAERGA